MATVENLESKILSLLMQDKSFVIGLTGEWGIGKTHFWKNLYKNHHSQFKIKKYAYVSLFGIESLEALKYEIAIKSYNTQQETDIFSGLKNFFSKGLEHLEIPKLESNGLAISISKALITNTISGLVKDTIICIDDLERISDKLSIKDVIGLINQLKVENNCQIIVILHEGKADKLFQEFKEKVFDNIFYLTENFSIIEKIVVNEMLVIYQEFYEKVQVKNLRFYEKVDKWYQQFIAGKSLSYTSKEYILKNFLTVFLLHDFPQTVSYDKNDILHSFEANLEFLTSSISTLSDNDFLKDFDHKQAFEKYTNNFFNMYEIGDWTKIIINYIKNYDVDNDVLDRLLAKDFDYERKIQLDILHNGILEEYHSFETKPDFLNRFHEMALSKIGDRNLNNLSFYLRVLKEYDANLAESYKQCVEKNLLDMITNSKTKPRILGDFYPFGKENYDIFYDFIELNINNYQPKAELFTIDDFRNIFLKFYEHGGSNDDQSQILELLKKEDLAEIIWINLEDNRSRKQFIKSILSHREFSNEKRKEVRQWIIELLNEKIQTNPEVKASISLWLKDTNNLTDFSNY